MGDMVDSQSESSSTDAEVAPTAQSNQDTERPHWVFYLNPAATKGVLMMAVGVFVLMTPDLSTPIVRAGVAIGLMVFGLTELWAVIRHWSDTGINGFALGVLSFFTGLAVLILADGVSLMLTFVGIYLLLRGLGAGLRLLFRRSVSVVMDVIAAGVQFSLGVMLVLLPGAVIQASIGAAAIVLLLLGGVSLAYGLRQRADTTDVDTDTLARIGKHWMHSVDLGAEQRNKIAGGLYFEPPDKAAKLGSWWVMLILSVAIATYAILQDSTAVVIGAMLVAPLMTPILGAAGAIVNGRKSRLVSSLLLVAGGVGAAILLAVIIGKWTPGSLPLETNTQITSRVSPNVIDMAIALAAGAAGAFATINNRVASGMAGVAIAVALVPPLGVVGLTLESGAIAMAWGAFLLFLTNFVAILLSATGVFVLGGWASIDRLRSNATSIAITTGTVLAAAMVIMLPLLFTSQGVLQESAHQATATRTVTDWVEENASDLAISQTTTSGREVTVRLEGAEQLPDSQSLADQLSEDLGFAVSLTVLLTPTQTSTYSSTTGVGG
jgi:uncharacterized hydrophobic protein (TIGR00271 family)